jgi:hypothetical protein
VTIGGAAVSETAVSAVPAMIHKVLFRPLTPIPPGERVDSAEIDVGGAQHVAVNVGIKGAGASVDCTIAFVHRPGPAGSGQGVAAVHTESMNPFGDDNSSRLHVFLPVHAPILQVELRNTGSEPARTLHTWVYGVRFAPSS